MLSYYRDEALCLALKFLNGGAADEKTVSICIECGNEVIITTDWFNKNHFDYRNLIEKGLAIDCTNLNIY